MDRDREREREKDDLMEIAWIGWMEGWLDG